MGNKRNLLLIDDDELYGRAFAERLIRNGFNLTIFATNADSVLTVIENHKIELVLLDLIMPGIDGKDILRSIRTRYGRFELPVIVVTGIDDSSDIKDTFDLGANDYLTKPVSVDVAAARVNAHLSLCDLDRELIKKKEVEVLNAMITTYSHEINNALCIAIAEFTALEKLHPDLFVTQFSKIQRAFERIQDSMLKIQRAGDKPQVFFENYVENSKMIKVR